MKIGRAEETREFKTLLIIEPSNFKGRSMSSQDVAVTRSAAAIHQLCFSGPQTCLRPLEIASDTETTFTSSRSPKLHHRASTSSGEQSERGQLNRRRYETLVMRGARPR